ncbi:hypothetical protein [Xanthomonas euvesicatoria]|jgi:hypothetical protein|uniref:hypothetical protein n=1 Tax=Xanthomonas euvesicatoria TaxID=456327 RepID=UPI0030C83116
MHYEIQRRPAQQPEAEWQPMANHGGDLEAAIAAARYYRRLLWNKAEFRVVVREGDSVGVMLQ